MDPHPVSPRAALAECAANIDARNAALGAVLTRNPCASDAALEAEARLASGAPADPLCGVPYIVKDNICVSGLPMTCGSKLLAHFEPGYDADCVAKLRAAGAVLVGKANLDEFAMGSTGELSAFGAVANPLDANCVSGGSSSGSAAAVASGMCRFALGSDTGGSVRVPAALCGVVGLKPTYGRVSRFGLTAFASSLDCVGVLARSVSDVAAVLRTLSGPTGRDDSQGRYLAYNDGTVGAAVDHPRDLSGIRIAVVHDALEAVGPDNAVLTAFRCALDLLHSLGATVDFIRLPELGGALDAYNTISSAEAYSNLARYDGIRYAMRDNAGFVNSDVMHPVAPGPARTFDAVIRENRELGFGPEVKQRLIRGQYVLSGASAASDLSRARALAARLRESYRSIFAGYSAIASPTVRCLSFPAGKVHPAVSAAEPTTSGVPSIHSDGNLDILTVAANLTGVPAITVPLRTALGTDSTNADASAPRTAPGSGTLCPGFQLEANYFDEATLFRLAAALERGS